jgi:hypothetical protein
LLIHAHHWPLRSEARFKPEIEAANAVIREIATRHGAAVIDLDSFIAPGGRLKPEMIVDGVHLSAKGLNIWVDQIGKTSLRRTNLSSPKA